jgi:hypothetical protein
MKMNKQINSKVPQELSFLKKLYKVSEEKNLYGTEKELFEKLNKK